MANAEKKAKPIKPVLFIFTGLMYAVYRGYGGYSEDHLLSIRRILDTDVAEFPEVPIYRTKSDFRLFRRGQRDYGGYADGYIAQIGGSGGVKLVRCPKVKDNGKWDKLNIPIIWV